MDVTIRRALPADVPGLVVLRATMFDAMGEPTGDGAPWRWAFAAWAEKALASEDAAAFVAEHRDLGLVSAAMGEITRKAPSPHNQDGISGHISNVVTTPAWRGRGLARGCVEELVQWFRTSTTVRDLNLHATSAGVGLYAALGFEVRSYPSMRLRMGEREARGSGGPPATVAARSGS